MKTWIKRTLYGLVLLSCCVVVAYFGVSYRGPAEFPDHTRERVDRNAVVDFARELTGTLYDPLMGMYDNIGGRMGFIVCADVPVIAYGRAGFSFRRALADDFLTHPDSYDTQNWNVPENPYFHRRSRNLFAYFAANDRLLPMTEQPKPGDLVFYKKRRHSYPTHVALVSEITPDGGYRIVESAPRTLLAGEKPGDSPSERDWIPLGIGRLVDAAPDGTSTDVHP